MMAFSRESRIRAALRYRNVPVFGVRVGVMVIKRMGLDGDGMRGRSAISTAVAPASPTGIAHEHALDARRDLRDFIENHRRLFVLTGAGCSTDSGIPDYRDRNGDWKRPPPMTYQAFMGAHSTRQRYWARGMLGWRRFGRAEPNATHHALAALEARGQLQVLLTQNVDGLHQRAGQRQVIDLHGRLDQVCCTNCARRFARAGVQQQLLGLNPTWATLDAADAPDGDAELDTQDFSSFVIPACPDCDGVLKPDVVFFGENVPRARVEQAGTHLQQADAMLIVGSSLMVFSGYRFAAAAARRGIPIAAVNMGRTRADELLTLKVEQSCAQALAFLH